MAVQTALKKPRKSPCLRFLALGSALSLGLGGWLGPFNAVITAVGQTPTLHRVLLHR
jgi:hypothetical protein